MGCQACNSLLIIIQSVVQAGVILVGLVTYLMRVGVELMSKTFWQVAIKPTGGQLPPAPQKLE